MPGKTKSDFNAKFLLVAFGVGGEIDSVTTFRAPAQDSQQAAAARALIAGVKEYQVYRILHPGKDKIEFKRVR